MLNLSNTQPLPNTIQYNTGEISHSPRGFSGLIYNTVWGTLAILLVTYSLQLIREVKDAPVQNKAKPQHRGQHPLPLLPLIKCNVTQANSISAALVWGPAPILSSCYWGPMYARSQQHDTKFPFDSYSNTCSKLRINNVITDDWQFTVTEWMESKFAMKMLENRKRVTDIKDTLLTFGVSKANAGWCSSSQKVSRDWPDRTNNRIIPPILKTIAAATQLKQHFILQVYESCYTTCK